MGRKPSRNLNLPKGMRARMQRSGITYYYYDTGNKPRHEIPLGSDYVEAVKQWAALEADQGSPHASLITFKYAADKYLTEVLPTKAPRTQSDNIKELAKLNEFFNQPPAPLAEIKPIHIRQYLDWRNTEAKKRAADKNAVRVKAGLTPLKITGTEGTVRANREKALFSHIWNKAREWGLTDRANPCEGVKGFKELGRDNYIDDIIYKAVWDAACEPLRNAMDIAYLIGQRPADVLKITRADIKEGELWVTQNKTGKKLRVTIQGELQAVIERIKNKTHKVTSLFLIVNDRGEKLTAATLRSRFDSARDAAAVAANNPAHTKAIRTFQFRDLRAKAGTDKETSGGMGEAKDLLGHANENMTRRYVRHRTGKLVSPTR